MKLLVWVCDDCGARVEKEAVGRVGQTKPAKWIGLQVVVEPAHSKKKQLVKLKHFCGECVRKHESRKTLAELQARLDGVTTGA